MPDVTHITACRLCESRDLELVVSFPATPPGDQYVPESKRNEPQPCYPLDVLRCRACDAVQLADTVDPALIYPEYLYTTSVSKGLDAHFEAYAATLPHARFAVDIGSNDGTLLRALQRRGVKVLGIDPAEAIAASALAFGVQTYTGFFGSSVALDVAIAYGQADLITANHVMANVADLPDFIDGVRQLLAQAGTFVFETGYWPAIVDGMLIDTIEHEHIHYFAVKPLRRFFRQHGLELVHVEVNSAKGGSVRGYVQHAAVAKPDATVGVLAANEQRADYRDLKTWIKSLVYLRASVHVEMLEAKARGETWVGYGAAVGSTLQLYHFGLGEMLTCLVDANPAKHGLLSPGFHLPVVSPDELARINPDRIVILAWRYAELIQRQHPEFAGKFLMPLPHLVTA